MKLTAVITDTIRESLAKKLFLGFTALSLLTILIFIFALKIDVVEGALGLATIFGQSAGDTPFDLEKFIFTAESAIASLLFAGGIFISLFATASLFPSMQEKGTIDLLLSKPISRTGIIVAKFLGNLAIVTFNVFFLIFGMWLVLSSKIGIWNIGFLVSGLTIIVSYAVLLTILAFVGILAQSTGLSIMITFLVAYAISPLLLLLQQPRILRFFTHQSSRVFIQILYYIFPKTTELGNITRLVVEGKEVASWMPLWSSLLFGAAVFGATVYLFYRKDY
ncbi:MAG: ABC transporter permease [Candidatus Aminicenantes bacterium]|nr:ABC transporter permease [Candidatus Aminicenantes bacterium]MDH5714473.1 ABC transporter permease [Candidatus Aminicenantes bacterium]